jgi:serine phosphatase RsbU (regulator of sigma subunit)
MSFFFQSIRSRILTFFLPLVMVVVMVLSLLNYLELDSIFTTNYKEVKEQLEHNIVNQIHLIDASYRMLEQVLELQIAKEAPIFLEAYKKSAGNPKNIDLANTLKNMEGISQLYVIDSTTSVIHTTVAPVLGLNFRNYAGNKIGDKIDAIRLGNSIKFERIRINVFGGALGMWGYIPTPDHKYVLELGYENTALASIVKDLDWLKAVEALRKDSPLVKSIRMFDTFGEQFVSSQNDAHKPTEESKKIVAMMLKEQRVEQELLGNDVTYLFIDLDKIKNGITDSGKIVEIVYDTQAIKAELRKSALVNIAIIVFSILITIILIYFISRFITRPIENLQKTAEGIARSENYDQVIPVLTKDEVGKLAESFGVMMKKIKHSYGILEDKVAERTYNLNQANEELKQTNEELAATVELVQIQKIEIESKNKNITSSINYARRIQSAILPSESKMKALLEHSFVVNMPRDIVSGDFYFVEQHLGKTFVSVSDCTGHGIPGGFMSMLGSQLLHEIILVRDIISPNYILDELNKNIIRILQQDVNDSRDGMDISIIAIDKTNKNIELSNAMNSIYVVKDGVLEEFKADKMPIGGSSLLYKKRFFTNRSIAIDIENPENSMVIYLCSDGYQDQFGGKDFKKFMSRNLKDLLISIADKSMSEQAQILESTIEIWKGHHEQTDDILILGIKL